MLGDGQRALWDAIDGTTVERFEKLQQRTEAELQENPTIIAGRVSAQVSIDIGKMLLFMRVGRALEVAPLSNGVRGVVPNQAPANPAVGEVAPAAPKGYGHLADPPTVGVGKDFTAAQKAEIIAANKARNGGVVKSDLSGEVLVPPAKSQKGVTPPANEWQIDHITAKDNGGTNSFGNAQVLSRAENRAKSNK
jgi:hypothetical protein